MKKKITFLTGTRADFGKLKPLMKIVQSNSDKFDCAIFATGMHLQSKYGMTINEIYKSGFTNVYTYINQINFEPMELVLSNTISGLSRYLHEYKPDLVVVHGDRVEALAGAIAGALQNILVAHIEGGEISGTIDELLRHATTKMAHLHFVASEKAKSRLIQLGERNDSIHVIGSPDIDIMLSSSLPSVDELKNYYNILFDKYSVVLYHPVTTDKGLHGIHAKEFVDALLISKKNYVVIYPNNDIGSEYIILEYERISKHPNFKIFPSIRFEYFLSLLKNSDFIIGNSSAGIHEAPVYGVPSINVGTRQHNRFVYQTILNSSEKTDDILRKINEAANVERLPCGFYGDGKSAEKFNEIICNDLFWETSSQKQLVELD